VIDLNAGGDQLSNLQREVGGLIDIVEHKECDLVINDEGRINGSPVNVRVTHFVLNDSAIAKEGRAWEGAVIHGNVTVTGGPGREGDQAAVSREMIDYFSSLQLDRNAMRDWDVRNVEWRVTSWDLDRDDGGYGLGL
jgi:Domain of unknown function (DUF3846)